MIGRIRRMVIHWVLAVSLVWFSGVRVSGQDSLDGLVDLVLTVEDDQFRLDLLRGMLDALKGSSATDVPAKWSDLEIELQGTANQDIKDLVREIGSRFGSKTSISLYRKILSDSTAESVARIQALDALIEAGEENIAAEMPELLKEAGMVSAVLKGMMLLRGHGHAEAVVAHYRAFSSQEKKLALQLLASREETALLLVEKIERGEIPLSDLRAEVARQMYQIDNEKISKFLKEKWGSVQVTDKTRKRMMEEYRNAVVGWESEINLVNGREQFRKLCSQCHKLFGGGGSIGPDLTGSNRKDLDYILENVIHPNAVVAKDFHTTTIETSDFRILSGFISGRTDESLTLTTAGGNIRVDVSEIESEVTTPTSMMPEGLLQGLEMSSVVDLVSYLKSDGEITNVGEKADLENSSQPFDLSGALAGNIEGSIVPAMAAAVVVDRKVVASGVSGIRKSGSDNLVTREDKFHLGSCTKSMTASLAAILVSEGRIDWSSRPSDVFSELEIHEGYQDATLLHLLSNSAGCPGDVPRKVWSKLWRMDPDPVAQRDYLVSEILGAAPEAEPGTKFIYSNAGFSIAGAMMEEVAGIPFEQLMQEKLFQPLGMSTAGFGPPASRGMIDQPYGHTKGVLKAKPVDPYPGGDNPPGIAPAGRVHCSIDDFARFVSFLIWGHERIPMEAAIREKLFQPVLPGGDYALGLKAVERAWGGGTVYTHAGTNTMFYSVMWIAPRKSFAIVVTVNTGQREAYRIMDTTVGQLIGDVRKGKFLEQ